MAKSTSVRRSGGGDGLLHLGGGMTRFTWGIVIGVLVLVGVSIGLAAWLPRVEQAPDLGTPEGVVLAYALAMQRAEPEAAWDLLAESTKSRTSRERFVARASGMRGRYQEARLTMENLRVDGDSARVELMLTRPGSRGPFGFGSGSYADRSLVTLVRQDAAWRIATPPDPFLVDGGR